MTLAPTSLPFAHVLYVADALGGDELDALPYGMIQLDPRGVVLRYSAAESRRSGLSAAECVGRHFFDDVAPCARAAGFYGRFRDGVRDGRLDAAFDFRFASRPPRAARVHLFYSRASRPVWVKVADAAGAR